MTRFEPHTASHVLIGALVDILRQNPLLDTEYNSLVEKRVGMSTEAQASWVTFHLDFLTVDRIRRPDGATLYSVHVGNIGMVHEGISLEKARETFRVYVEQSKSELGRASGEPVILMDHNDIVDDYMPGDYETE